MVLLTNDVFDHDDVTVQVFKELVSRSLGDWPDKVPICPARGDADSTRMIERETHDIPALVPDNDRSPVASPAGVSFSPIIAGTTFDEYPKTPSSMGIPLV